MPAHVHPMINHMGPYSTVKEFNSWLVGGSYVVKRLHDAKPAPLPKTESSERLKLKIAQNRQKLQSSHRSHLRRKPAPAPAPAAPPAASPKAPNTARGKPTPPSPHHANQNRPNTSDNPTSLRLQLKTSLIEGVTQSNYISMFPPLFTPYDRSNTMLRGWNPSMKEYYDKTEATSPKKAKTALSEEAADEKTAPKHQGIIEQKKVRVAQKNRPSHQGQTGRPGFYPTGSSVNAYRHFTNYRLALELESREKTASPKGKAKQQQSLQQLLRAQCSNTETKPSTQAAVESPTCTALVTTGHTQETDRKESATDLTVPSASTQA